MYLITLVCNMPHYKMDFLGVYVNTVHTKLDTNGWSEALL